MNVLSWIISILGLIATILGCLLAFFTYVSPLWRLRLYLNQPSKWKKTNISRVEWIWQYKRHPEFILEIDNESKEWTTKETWMKDYPDPIKHTSIVRAKVNGQTLLIEEFISMDGGRYFIPVPKRRFINGDNLAIQYGYDITQVNIAKIIGYFYNDKTIEQFMNNHRLSVISNKDKGYF